jgi:hypothetical protein
VVRSCRIRSYAFLALLVSSVAGADEPLPVDSTAPRITFELDVLPVLTAAGCNQGACHGKSRGQNGFQLSLLGSMPISIMPGS